MQPDRKHLNPGRSIPFSPCKSVPIFLIYAHARPLNSMQSKFCKSVPQAERDAHFVRDVSFGSDVRFAREDAEHITSLCDETIELRGNQLRATLRE